MKDNDLRVVKMQDVRDEQFDSILITDECPEIIHDALSDIFKGNILKIKYLFNNKYLDERQNYNFALKRNLSKYIKNLAKKLENKKVLFYGGGSFFKLLCDDFGLTSINALGVVDRGACLFEEGKEVRGYRMYMPDEIPNLKPDCIVVTSKVYYNIARYIYGQYIKNSRIKLYSVTNENLFNVLFTD